MKGGLVFKLRSKSSFFGKFCYCILLFSVFLFELSPGPRANEFEYRYLDRSHSKKETFSHLSKIYALTWVFYPAIQPNVFLKKGSLKKYQKNFGKRVFDRDEPFWNVIVHPISGSQLYLYYRANGYDRISSFGLAFISSALFEFTVEVYTEPASVQDLYQTPVLGSILGFGIEKVSLFLLNSNSQTANVIGHIINPSTLLWFFEGKVQLLPTTNFKDKTGFNLKVTF